jgi:tetratricopeptide (TPR) repeat protein
LRFNRKKPNNRCKFPNRLEKQGVVFILQKIIYYTMNPAPWISLVILLMVLAGCAGIQGVIADGFTPEATGSVPSISAIESAPGPTISPTVKTTIAPIHTKEPDVKPPVDQPSVSPSLTPDTGVPQVKPSPTAVTPAATLTPGSTERPGDNETASTYFQWGRAFEDAGDYQAAVKEFDRAIAREPYYADAWYHKALCLENLGQWDEAYQAYRFLLTIDPGYPAQDNLSGDRLNNSSFRPLPPDSRQTPGTPVFWLASGALLALMIFAGGYLYYRRMHTQGRDMSDTATPARQIPVTAGPFPDIDAIEKDISPYYSGDREVFCAVMKLAIEIAREGREGKPVGTAFILGDSDEVLSRSRQLILNPLAGHSENHRLITSPDMRENIKELSLVDGAFVIRENGIVEAAGRYISIDTSRVRLPKGFGTRHVSVAAVTQETSALGIVVSESGGMVRVFAKGKVIVETM